MTDYDRCYSPEASRKPEEGGGNLNNDKDDGDDDLRLISWSDDVDAEAKKDDAEFEPFEYGLSAPIRVSGQPRLGCRVEQIVQLSDETLVSCSKAGELHHFSKEGELLKRFDGSQKKDDGVLRSWHCITEIADGILASSGMDRDIRLWHVSSGRLLCESQIDIKDVICLLRLREPNKFASGSYYDAITIWEVDYQPNAATAINQLHLMQNPGSGSVMTLCELSNGLLLGGTGAANIDIWSSDRSHIACIKAHYREVLSLVELVVDDDGKIIVASGSRDNTTKIWNIDDRCCLRVLTLSDTWVLSVGKIRNQRRCDNNVVMRTCIDNLTLWNWRTGKELLYHRFDAIQCGVVMRDGTIVICQSDEDNLDEHGEETVKFEFRHLYHRSDSLVHMCCFLIATHSSLRKLSIAGHLPQELIDICQAYRTR